MTAYPGAVYAPRTVANKSGIVYDADKDTILFAEDINKATDEIVAIETELGENPKGSDADVATRLDRMDGATGGFTYKGPKTAVDYTEADLTQDDSWHDLDISTKISAGAKAVLIQVVLLTINDNSTISFRKNGTSETSSAACLSEAGYDVPENSQLWIVPDANGVIEYMCAGWSYSSIDITIIGCI